MRSEYRVMYYSAEFGKWYPHAQPTPRLPTAEAWAEQAQYRGGRGGKVPVRIEVRQVSEWSAKQEEGL